MEERERVRERCEEQWKEIRERWKGERWKGEDKGNKIRKIIETWCLHSPFATFICFTFFNEQLNFSLKNYISAINHK